MNNSSKDFFELPGYSEQDLNYRITLCVIHAFICITAVFGNSLILITIWKTSSLHSVANILLSSLAVSDLALGLFCEPLFLTLVWSKMETVKLLVSICGAFFFSTSFSTITAIGIDRLLALQLHLRYKALVTAFRVNCVVALIWVYSGIYSTILWFPNHLDIAIVESVYIMLILVTNFVVYLKIYLIVRRHQRQIQTDNQLERNNNLNVKRFKKSAVKTFLVFIFLLSCNMPYSIVALMVFEGLSVSRSFVTAGFTLVFLSSALNPFLFYWRDREIRRAMKQMLCRGC